MEFITDNNYQNNDEHKGIKTLIIVLIVLVVLTIIGVVFALGYLENQRFKFIVNGKEITTYSEDLFKFEEESNKPYISIRDFSEIVGYKSYKGDFKAYEEDLNFCYIQDDYEVTSYEYDSKRIYKTTSPIENVIKPQYEYEYFELNEEVRKINDKLYTTEEGIEIGCNVKFEYDVNKNAINVVTRENLIERSKNIEGNVLYKEESDGNIVPEEMTSELYNYSKCLLYDMIVTKNKKNEIGIIGIDGKEIIGNKYAKMKFIESNQMFLVTTIEGRVGMVDIEGETQIKPEYDEIKLIDKNLKLYLVKNEKKYGIVNSIGDTVLHLEYDEIGIDPTKIKNNEIKNQYLLYEKYVPVKRDNKWGIIEVSNNANQIVIPIKYDDLGSKGDENKINKNSQSTSSSGIVLIPEYKAFVVKEKDYYGIVNVKGEVLVPPALTEVYSIRKNGKVEYWMIYKETNMNILEYLKQNYINKSTEN